MKRAFIGISRHRLLRDGQGVTTLAAFHGCPLDCKYCLNPSSKGKLEEGETLVWHTPQSLIDAMMIDNIYFQATGGGACFGGGEPLLHTDFIQEFGVLCPKDWKITIETSLNVSLDNVMSVANIIDQWIIDVKDTNPEIYWVYTGKENDRVIENLGWLADNGYAERMVVRIPHIPSYNTQKDVEASEQKLRKWGCHRFEHLQYVLPNQLAAYHKRLKSNAKQPYGKDVCAVLKAIRQLIADKNDILFHPHVCTHEGACLGTCPACEKEVRFIEKALEVRRKNGEKIII